MVANVELLSDATLSTISVNCDLTFKGSFKIVSILSLSLDVGEEITSTTCIVFTSKSIVSVIKLFSESISDCVSVSETPSDTSLCALIVRIKEDVKLLVDA